MLKCVWEVRMRRGGWVTKDKEKKRITGRNNPTNKMHSPDMFCIANIYDLILTHFLLFM